METSVNVTAVTEKVTKEVTKSVDILLARLAIGVTFFCIGYLIIQLIYIITIFVGNDAINTKNSLLYFKGFIEPFLMSAIMIYIVNKEGGLSGIKNTLGILFRSGKTSGASATQAYYY